jgi:GT2 family glycosyltransferase
MENRFVMPHQSSYDVVIIIPTIEKSPNQQRVETIINLIQQNPLQGLTWNIFLAYEGRDWNEAVNKAFQQVAPTVKLGFIFLDDDSFPLPHWSDNLIDYINDYPSTLIQFCLLDKKGFYSQYYFSQVDNCSRTFNKLISKLTPHSDTTDLNNYIMIAKTAYYTKLKKPVKAPFACFSAVFVPKQIYETIGGVKASNDIVYSEDLDFCFRAMNEGYNSIVIPRHILHLVGTTKLKKPEEYIKKISASTKWLCDKWFTKNKFVNSLEKQGFIKPLTFMFLWRNSAKFLRHRAKNHEFLKNFTERLEFAF